MIESLVATVLMTFSKGIFDEALQGFQVRIHHYVDFCIKNFVNAEPPMRRLHGFDLKVQ